MKRPFSEVMYEQIGGQIQFMMMHSLGDGDADNSTSIVETVMRDLMVGRIGIGKRDGNYNFIERWVQSG